MIKISYLINFIPNNQDIIFIIDEVEYSKYCDLTSCNRIGIHKFKFDNVVQFLQSDVYVKYKDYYIDHLYSFRDSLCFYIYEVQ